MARNSNSGWSRPWAAFFALVIILGGVAVSLGFGVRLRSALERNADKRITTTSATVQTAVADELSRYADSVRLAAAALSALPAPTRDGFDEITAALAAQDLTAVRAITFVVPAAPDEVDQVRPYWRDLGAEGLRPQAVQGLQQHLFTVYARGLGKQKAPPIGVDQGVAQAEVDVARLARTGKDVAISDAYVRLADTTLPPVQQRLSFDVVAPVYGAGKTVAGFMVLNVVGAEFISTTLYRAAGDLLDAQLLTRSGTGGLAEVAAVIRQGQNGTQFRRTSNFEAGQRQWTLRTSASYQTLLPNAGRTDVVVVVAGSALAVMFGTLMYLQMSATKRTDQEIELEVAERIEEFEATGEPARRQRSLVAQEALVTRLLSAAAAASTAEVDLRALVDQAVAAAQTAGPEDRTDAGPAEKAEAGPEGETEEQQAAVITVGDLPAVRTNAALLRFLVDTMLADALRRTPDGEAPQVAITAEPGPDTVRLLVDSSGTTVGCTLPAAARSAIEQMAANPS